MLSLNADRVLARAPLPVEPMPAKSRERGNVLTCDIDYSADETEFVLAMDRYKREKRRPFPTWSEALAVLRSLGYRKAIEPTETT